jgi:uncharacterized protein YkwD
MLAKLALCAAVMLAAEGNADKANVDTQAAKATANSAAQPDKPAAQPVKDQAAQAEAEKAKKTDAAAPAEKSKESDLIAIEANIVSYTNAQRARYGLPALEVDQGLMNSARSHCAWMARSQNLVHTNQPVGENIAMGQASSSEAVRDWMNSSGHRANILNRGYRHIGVAAYRSRSGAIFWCQQFRW